MEKSESIKNLAQALVKFQSLVGIIPKDSKNPFFKSAYAALPDILGAIHQPLIESGLTVNQFPTGNNGLTTIIIHSDSGEFMLDTYFMAPTKNDPQGIGSCITYQRRYAIGAVLSLNIDEDDDGNAGSKKPDAKTETKAKETPKPIEHPPLIKNTDKWKAVVTALTDKVGTIEQVRTKYTVSAELEKELNDAVKELQASRVLAK